MTQIGENPVPVVKASKKVLMIAYLFPPVGGSGAAGAQRAAKFAKYLPDFGWRPVILTINEDEYEDYCAIDRSLLKTVPADIQIIRTSVIRWFSRMLNWRSRMRRALALRGDNETVIAGASSRESRTSDIGSDPASPSPAGLQKYKDMITDLFEIPDGQAGWIVPAVRQGLKTIRSEDIEAIMATGKPWSGLVIGATLSKLTGKPLFADFRDPWMTNPYRLSASASKNLGEAKLEESVVRQATVVIATTDELRDEFLTRFPSEPREKFVSLLNGFDPEVTPQPVERSTLREGVFQILHAGFIYGLRDPKTFLEGLHVAIQEEGIDRDRVQVTLLGSIDLAYDLDDALAELNLGNTVHAKGQVPFEEVGKALGHADLLLLLQPGTKTQIPSKLFEYIASGKPILAVTPLDGGTARLVDREGFGLVASPDDPQQIAKALISLYRRWREGTEAVGLRSADRQKFNIKRITGELATLLDANT